MLNNPWPEPEMNPNRPRLKIEPGAQMTRSKISIAGIDVLPWITSATMTIKPGKIADVKIRFMEGTQIPADLTIALYVVRKVNGHR